MSLLKAPRVFKPMIYPEAFEYWNTHDKLVWHWDEVPLGGDVADFMKDTEENKEFITSVMRLFTQNDIEVAHGYDVLLRIFKPTEVTMMLRGNADRENTHIAVYSLFTETLGFEDSFYTEFLEDDTMSDKIDYVEKAQVQKYEEYEKDYEDMFYKNKGDVDISLDEYISYRYRQDIMFMLAVYASLTEGVSLFAQFAMLLAYQFDNKYKGLCTIVEWSIKDEESHVQSNSWLFRTFVGENMDVFDDNIKRRIYQAARDIVDKECKLIDELNPPHLDNEVLKEYVKYITDERLKLIGFKPNWGIEKNPLPFMEEVTQEVLTNMFSGRVTEYAKASISGSWEDVRANKMSEVYT